jgi:NAD(P)-dependent dehydrogenase (short-subunit alcohol dehydrogenase family)
LRATEQAFDLVFGVNVRGAIFSVQKALPLMREDPNGDRQPRAKLDWDSRGENRDNVLSPGETFRLAEK